MLTFGIVLQQDMLLLIGMLTLVGLKTRAASRLSIRFASGMSSAQQMSEVRLTILLSSHKFGLKAVMV